MRKQDVEGTQVFVCPVRRRRAEVEDLQARVEALGGTLVGKDAIAPSGCDDYVRQADVLVVLICPESANDPEVKDLVETASRLGKRIIAVWLPGCGISELPPFLNREADGVVCLGSPKLKEAVLEDEEVWEKPDGTAQPDRKIPRHNCRT